MTQENIRSRKQNELRAKKTVEVALQKARHTASRTNELSMRKVQDNLDAKINARRATAERILEMSARVQFETGCVGK